MVRRSFVVYVVCVNCVVYVGMGTMEMSYTSVLAANATKRPYLAACSPI